MTNTDYSGEVVDVEVGRYGLRTFRHIPYDQVDLDPHHLFMQQLLRMDWYGAFLQSHKPMELCSTAMLGSHWKTGVCEATCQMPQNAHLNLLIELAALTAGVEPVYGHQAPQEDCHCGIYAAHSLEVLRAQFSYVDDIVAVVAAEGQTIIGDKGFRTQRARVVAYWCTDDVAATAQGQFSEAQRYSEIALMLTDYGLERGTPVPDYWPSVVFSAGKGGGGGGATLSITKGDPGVVAIRDLPSNNSRRRRRKVAAASVNFAFSAGNGSLFLLSHHWLSLLAAIISFTAGVYFLAVSA